MIAVVSDARYRTALAAIRCLGRAGVPVVAVERDDIPPRDVIGFYSRWTLRRVTVPPPPEGDAGPWLEHLAAAVGADREPAVWLPAAMGTLRTAVVWQDRLPSGLRALLPDPAAFALADDKAALLELARREGVPVPETWRPEPGESPEDLARRVRYPLVIKYRNGEVLGLPPHRRYAVVRDRREFVERYRAMHRQQPDPVVQEYVPGDSFGFAAAARDGRVYAAFCHRRLRQYPVTGGPSTMAVSIRDDRLVDLGSRLLKALNWSGVAMVEFKQDAAGEFRLMEINPRLWGSLPLAVAAGADIPLVWYRLAAGEDVEPDLGWREGVRMRFLFQDLLAARDLIRTGREKPSFALRYLRELLDPRVVDGVFSRQDPRPGWAYLWRSLRRAVD